MTKILPTLFAACILSCSCLTSSGVGKFNPTDDETAAEAQRAIESSVHVLTRILSIQVQEKVPGKPGAGPETPPIPRISGWSGSGMIVAVKGGKSLVLTAGHVCAVPSEFQSEEKTWHVQSSSFKLTNFWGMASAATVVSLDKKADICFLQTESILGRPVSFSADPLPVGAEVLNVGWPTGIQGEGYAHIGTGRYCGTRIDLADGFIYSVFSSATIGGSSGSGIFYRGKVVGMIRAVNANFHHIGLALPVSKVSKMAEEAKNKWSQ